MLDADPVNDAPILDLRLRKGIRRHGLKLAVASAGEGSLDPSAHAIVRYAPGGGAAFAAALAAALSGDDDVAGLAGKAGAEEDAVRKLADVLRGPAPEDGEDAAGAQPREVVVLWGERLTAGPNGDAGARALLAIADALKASSTEGAGLLEIPSQTNGRGLREAGVLPNAGAGLSEPEAAGGRDARAIAEGLADGSLSALYCSSPSRCSRGDRALWEGPPKAATVIAHATFMTEAIREHADVVFPAEVYAEKEGTVVHPDGRIQRLRPAIARAGEVRAGWQVISELALRLGRDFDVLSGAGASRILFESVPFYAGLTLEEIAGRGVRWQERESASEFPPASLAAKGGPLESPAENAAELDGYRSVWDAPELRTPFGVLRSTRGYIPSPRWGERLVSSLLSFLPDSAPE